MGDVSIVVMEKQSDWPGHVVPIEDVIAFSQDDLGLLQRTQEKLAALRFASQSVRLAVLACNESCGRGATDRRARVARELLAAVSDARCGRLVLSARADASPSLREELLGLAGDLTHELGPASPTISLHFFTAAPRTDE
jgi:hypothetical protein